MTVITFERALQKAEGNRHLLLGNGFSMAIKRDIFSYNSLYENADFSKVPYAEKIFEALDTRDFEAVIRLLIDMAKVLKAYKKVDPSLVKQIEYDANIIKDILVTTIASKHPDRPYDISNEAYAHCREFLSNFSKIYTLNYDILLYWAVMHEEEGSVHIHHDDGFRSPEEDEAADYVSWQEHNSPSIYYLHGALHLFDAGHEIIKYTWSRTDVPIIEQIRIALDEGKYPMFVSEGYSKSKQEKILHNAYLHKAFRSFSSITGSIFIFGHSLDDNDDHVFNEIVNNTKIHSLYISIFGDPSTATNKKIIQKASTLIEKRLKKAPRKPLSIEFFDAESAHTWG
ncbi:MAG: DUF4917 family protein [Alphaproteobacteria bacterium]